MTTPRERRASAEHVATVGMAFVIAALAALGVAWWADGVHRYDTPAWNGDRFVPLTPATDIRGERWLVAVNLRCPHCRAHLRAVSQRIARRARPPALAALIVDQPARPHGFELGVPLAGGVWWDSAAVWRECWGRRVYGETFRFDARGRLLSATPAGMLPDSTDSPM